MKRLRQHRLYTLVAVATAVACIVLVSADLALDAGNVYDVKIIRDDAGSYDINFESTRAPERISPTVVRFIKPNGKSVYTNLPFICTQK